MGNKNLAYHILQSGRVITNVSELRSIAVRMGYELTPSREGYKVISEGDIINVIPHRHVSKYVSRNILMSLANKKRTLNNNGH